MPVPKSKAPRRPNAGSHTFDPATGDLTVHFTSGRSYRYANVDPDTAALLDNAPSLGTALHKHVIGRHDGIEIFPKRDD